MSYQSVFKQDLFAGQTVVITGGGSGIGRCTAHELASLGGHVAIIGRNADKLDAVQAEIRSDGGQVSIHTADIRDEAAVSNVVDAILAEHGRIDGLFNNAGGQYRAPLETISTKGFEAVVRNNLTGGFIVMREVYTRWMKERGGAIVNMIADIWHGWPHFMARSAESRQPAPEPVTAVFDDLFDRLGALPHLVLAAPGGREHNRCSRHAAVPEPALGG